MSYPLISEYIEAIMAPEDNFKELTNLTVVPAADGQPVMSSGNFAVVFKMQDKETGKLYALKCFTKEQEGREDAYHQIADELKDVDSPYLVPLRYLDKELFVDTEQTDETEFPVLLMDWVDGKTLDKYLRENLDDKYALEMLAYRFSQLAQWLIPQPFAHGDLKPDNILVREDGSLVLVDYDGMYVPAMKGQKARELGSPDFRHPLRTDNDFDEHIDDFSLALILLSLKAISFNPCFWEEYGASDRMLIGYNEFHDLKDSRFLRDIIPSGNSIVDRYAFLFSMVYYEKKIPSHFYNCISYSKPLPFIPYTIGKHLYTLYDTANKKVLPLQYKYIDFIDPTFKASSSCIISDDYCGHGNIAIISHPHDLNHINWYKLLKNRGSFKTCFIVKNALNKYGIIDDKNRILLDISYQEIESIEVGEELYLLCKKDNCYLLYNKKMEMVIPYALSDLQDYSWHKLIVFKNKQNSTIALDLSVLKEYKFPADYGRIVDYKEGIITFEIAEEQFRFFNLYKERYINSYIYQTISIINKSFVLCRRNHTNILVSIDGTEYPIDFEGVLSQYGETVIGISPIEIKYNDQYGFEETKTNYDVHVFNKNILQNRFAYKDSCRYRVNFELINENTISVWHYGKWTKTGVLINLKGERVSWPNSNSNRKENNAPNEESHLIALVKEKYLNSTYIENYDKIEIDQCCYFEINDLGGIAFVTYHWENGSCDYEDHYEGNVRIGYADENMCYWAKDCMIKHI